MFVFPMCINKDYCSCVLYLYRPVQRNVHRRWEMGCETLICFTYGELLAI
jgi:hypothetical protein